MPKVNRRGFFGVIAGAFAALKLRGKTLAPEKRPTVPHVDGANQTGWLIKTAGWKPGTKLWISERIVFAGVEIVNPIHGGSAGIEASFAISENVVADSAGRATIHLGWGLLPSGQYRNCTCAPADGAAIKDFPRFRLLPTNTTVWIQG